MLCCGSHWLKGFCFGSLFSNFVLDALYRSASILLKKMAGCFTLNKPWLSMFISHGAMDQSAVCNCDISWPYSIVESMCLLAIQIAPNLYYLKKNDVYVTINIWKYLAIHVSVTIYTLKRVAFNEALKGNIWYSK